jgi:hypothetical protein
MKIPNQAPSHQRLESQIRMLRRRVGTAAVIGTLFGTGAGIGIDNWIRTVHQADALVGQLSQPLDRVKHEISDGEISDKNVTVVGITNTPTYAFTIAREIAAPNEVGTVAGIIDAQQGQEPVPQDQNAYLPTELLKNN